MLTTFNDQSHADHNNRNNYNYKYNYNYNKHHNHWQLTTISGP